MEHTTAHHHMPSGRTLALLGAGAAAAAGLGTYLYKRPKLRRKLWKADSVTHAATMLGSEIRHDSAEMADMMVAGISENVASGLKSIRRTLGSRFMPGRRTQTTAAKVGAKHVKNEARHLKNVAMNEARHAAGTVKNEMEHIKGEADEATDVIGAQMAR